MFGCRWLLILAQTCGPKTALALLAPRQLTTKPGFLTRSSGAQSLGHPCFASYSGVPGEIAVGVSGRTIERIQFITVSDCQEACNNNPKCNSFLACPYLDNTCFLKDYDLVPGAHIINKSDGDCQNYYKTHCNGCFRMDAEKDPELLAPMPAAITGSSFTKSQLEHCRGVCAADVDCQHFVVCPRREKCYVNAELPPAELNCKRFIKYTTRGQVPCLDFPEVGARSHTQTLPRFPQGKCVAVGFHGQYQRHQLRQDRGEGCSDYFQSAQNIKDMIISPLGREGIDVRTYFHTIHRSDCPAKDEMLISSIDPTRYIFEVQPMARIVDSYISVINLILLDADSVDNIVLIRFDVQYKLPITYLGIDWGVTNLPFKDLPENWDEWNKVSDLFLAFPIGHASAVIAALDRSDARDGDGGHYMYRPLAETLGKESVRFIDLGDGYTSDQNILTTSVFLGIDRSCSSTYFNCEDSETTAKSTTPDSSPTTTISNPTTITTSTTSTSSTTIATLTSTTDASTAATTVSATTTTFNRISTMATSTSTTDASTAATTLTHAGVTITTVSATSTIFNSSNTIATSTPKADTSTTTTAEAASSTTTATTTTTKHVSITTTTSLRRRRGGKGGTTTTITTSSRRRRKLTILAKKTKRKKKHKKSQAKDASIVMNKTSTQGKDGQEESF